MFLLSPDHHRHPPWRQLSRHYFFREPYFRLDHCWLARHSYLGGEATCASRWVGQVIAGRWRYLDLWSFDSKRPECRAKWRLDFGL